MIRLRGIVRSFGETRVLAGVNLDVARGEMVAIVGDSGSGKTTLLHVLATLLPADGGTVEIEGLDSRMRTSAARKKIALADGWLAPGDEITTAEYLELASGSRRGSGADAVTRAGLNPASRIEILTRDERVRLSLACALESRRDVILIDAPIDSCFADRIAEVLAGGAAIVATAPIPRTSRTLRLHHGRLEASLPASPREVAWTA